MAERYSELFADVEDLPDGSVFEIGTSSDGRLELVSLAGPAMD